MNEAYDYVDPQYEDHEEPTEYLHPTYYPTQRSQSPNARQIKV